MKVDNPIHSILIKWIKILSKLVYRPHVVMEWHIIINFKFNNIYIVNKPYIRFYSTSPNSPSNDIPNNIKLYEDAYLMRKSIIKENKGKSGIYKWTNKLTNDIYIGQSKDYQKDL